MQFNFRNFGPGVIVGSDPFAGLPNGVSISIQKQNDKPTHITVQRGDDKWDITGDDAEALKKLPDDLRPAVERMLHGGGGMGGAMGGAGNFACQTSHRKDPAWVLAWTATSCASSSNAWRSGSTKCNDGCTARTINRPKSRTTEQEETSSRNDYR